MANYSYSDIVTRRRETVFVEIQRFRQLWIWILLSAIAVITIGNLAIGMYREFVLGKPFSHGEFLSNGTWLMIWVIGVGATIGPILLLWYASYRDKPRGVTDVRNGGIR
jgi:hypothetical protein